MLVVEQGRLLIRVWDREASYPLRIDPLIQAATLTPNDATAASTFGGAVAVSADGNTALVGGGGQVGGAWVFTRSGGVWTQQGPKLAVSDAINPPFDQGLHLGASVALSADGNTALIGGPGDNDFVGAAWVFTRSGGVWTQQGSKLTGSGETGPGGSAGEFGNSAALSADGNTALIGALRDGTGFGTDVGAAWVFTRSGSTWSQQGAKLTPSDEVGPGAFGDSVALSGDGNTALIGGVNDNNSVGAAWVFTRSGGVWTQQGAGLSPNDEVGRGRVGSSVALSGDGNTALIGAPTDGAGNVALGASWVFTRSGGTWTQQGAKLTPDDENLDGRFGSGVALSTDGNSALIGGANDNHRVGAAWVFARSGSTWTQQGAKLTASDETGQGGFGTGVAFSTDATTALIGGSFAWVFTGSPTAPGLPPSNTSPPMLSGTAQVGSQLTASAGSWNGAPTSYSIGWLRCDTAGANCTPISNQTDLVYTLVAADQGKTIRAALTATNANGSTTTNSAPSAVVQPGTVAPPTVTQSIVDGSTIAGQATWAATTSAPAWGVSSISTGRSLTPTAPPRSPTAGASAGNWTRRGSRTAPTSSGSTHRSRTERRSPRTSARPSRTRSLRPR